MCATAHMEVPYYLFLFLQKSGHGLTAVVNRKVLVLWGGGLNCNCLQVLMATGRRARAGVWGPQASTAWPSGRQGPQKAVAALSIWGEDLAGHIPFPFSIPLPFPRA